MKISIRYHQNFIRDQRLAASLVRRANFGAGNTVYEIGPGRGIITRELAKTGIKVVAVEIDRRLAQRLKQDFSGNSFVKIVCADWLKFRPQGKNFQVIGNIPFNLTARIVNRLVNDPDFVSARLVMQKQAAEKFTGIPHSTQWSVLHLPWFEIKIVWRFRRSDFFPEPKVETIMLSIIRRKQPLISGKQEYFRFVTAGFNRIKPLFTYRQWCRLSRDGNFSLPVRPGELSFDQWLGIFKFYQNVLK